MAEKSPDTMEGIILSDSPSFSDTSIRATTSHSNANSDSFSSSDDNDSLEFIKELQERGDLALQQLDYPKAAACFGRAVKISVKHYGELAPECVNAYYKYGRALLNKSQKEAQPLASVPLESQPNSDKDESTNDDENDDVPLVTVPINIEKHEDKEDKRKKVVDTEEMDESQVDPDLDLAWTMLNLARSISKKLSLETMEDVNILSSLAEVALEREDIKTSFNNYHKALDILERIDEPDSRRIAELNYKICLCLEVGCEAREAIPHCENAISTCKARLQRLARQVKDSYIAASPSDQTDSPPSVNMDTDEDLPSEIEGLTAFIDELENKLEDLQQQVSNPISSLFSAMRLKPSKTTATRSLRMNACNSRSGTNKESEVTHLGRGVKHLRTNSDNATEECSPSKKPLVDHSPLDGDSNASSR